MARVLHIRAVTPLKVAAAPDVVVDAAVALPADVGAWVAAVAPVAGVAVDSGGAVAGVAVVADSTEKMLKCDTIGHETLKNVE